MFFAIGTAKPDIEAIGDPSRWSEWRTGPVAFPTFISPAVPEMLQAGPAVDFGKAGEDLAVILPEHPQKPLDVVSTWMKRKAPKSIIATDGLAEKRNLLLLGTLADNAQARTVLGDRAGSFMAGIPAGGYHIQSFPHPSAPGKRAILALGADAHGAWQAALVFYFSFHKAGSGQAGWPVRLPKGPFWAPYEAKCCTVTRPAASALKPGPPRIPFGVRTWGSPTPTLATYQRIIDALQRYKINTIVLDPGGWQDMAGAGEICRRAVDMAYHGGIYTILYVCNDEKAHLPAPLTAYHKAMVMAAKDHPGLLSWQLYNQLSDQLSQAQRTMLQEQVKWLKSVSDKPVGMEVVWGHNSGPAPPGKVQLISDLRSWGVTEFHHDYAPIGGWSKSHNLQLWEERLGWFQKANLPPAAVLQGHVPFLEPTLPTRAEVRNQFWWCVAAGARGFFFEAAYIFNRFSTRGLLTWGLEPVPDGRLDEIGALAPVAHSLEDMLLLSRSTDDDSSFRITKGAEKVAPRLRKSGDSVLYAVLINRDAQSPASAECSVTGGGSPEEIAPGGTMHTNQNRIVVDLPPGGGACIRMN